MFVNIGWGIDVLLDQNVITPDREVAVVCILLRHLSLVGSHGFSGRRADSCLYFFNAHCVTTQSSSDSRHW